MASLMTQMRCLVRGHNYDMVFNNPSSLNWEFVCCDCGHTVDDMDEAVASQRKLNEAERKREKLLSFAKAYGAPPKKLDEMRKRSEPTDLELATGCAVYCLLPIAAVSAGICALLCMFGVTDDNSVPTMALRWVIGCFLLLFLLYGFAILSDKQLGDKHG